MKSSQQLWNEIKEKSINVFAMESTVEKYFKRLDIDDKKCYLECKASAALPALETALGEKFSVSLAENNYVLVQEVEGKK